MNCNLCNITSDLKDHINPVWYCPECSDKSFFKELKELYNTNQGKKILYVSSKVNRLDEVSTFVIGSLDLFNVKNSIILLHAEGIPNLRYPVDHLFIDDDAISEGYSALIQFTDHPDIRFVKTGWQTYVR